MRVFKQALGSEYAVSHYVSLFTTLAWIVFLAALLFVFRKPLGQIIVILEDRVRGGASVKLGSFEIGEFVTRTADLSGESPEIYGNPDQLRLLFKVQTNEFKKSTKAMQTPDGCLVQVSTERRGTGNSWVVAEALVFVPGVSIADENGVPTLRAAS
jgi:hypothetical protein